MTTSYSPSPANAELAVARSEVESQLSSLVYGPSVILKLLDLLLYGYVLLLFKNDFEDLSQRVQVAMEDMLKMITEIDQNSADIMDEIKNCKDFALERKRTLEEDKEHFQRAAYAVINMLNNQEIS